MRIYHEETIGVRVPKSLRRRLARIGQIKIKSTSELAREALREYVERHDQQNKVVTP